MHISLYVHQHSEDFIANSAYRIMSIQSEVKLLSDGYFTLDPGAIFGIVPRPVWSKAFTADLNFRIKLALNIPLIINGSYSVLLDSGIGDLEDEKFKKIYEVERGEDLINQIQTFVNPDDLNLIVHSHLHFDHMGNSFNSDGKPIFRRAKLIAQKDEVSGLRHPNEITRSSYRKYPKTPGGFRAIDGSVRIKDGLQVVKSGGHTRGHQVIIYRTGMEELIYFGDLVPTSFHLRLPYITAIDGFPMDTLYWKKKLISKAIRDHALCIFNHDTQVKAAYLSGETGNPKIERVDL
jgi:glyoxylase-like metal-dependent hydrolase (beta-lactamase superfamily II)